MDETKSDAPAAVQEVDFVALPAGEKIGRYEVLSVLGQGGFGITYLARDAQLGREVAIKEYLPTSLAIRQNGATVLPRSTKVAEDFIWGRDRFVAEGRTLATLHQAPGIVRVFDFLETNGTAYIVMEMLHGETLEGHLKRHGPLPPPDIERILWPLLDGLEQVHQSGFLHRDIKPANILLNERGNPTLIDFGASRAAMAGRTTAMTAIFTPGYAAAEQMTSAKQGPWTDIYGLSATLYHAIVGAPPPNAFERMLDDDYQSLGKRAPSGFPPGLLTGIDAGLQVRASDRPQSIAGWRSILTMAAPSLDDATRVTPRQPQPRPAEAPTSAPQAIEEPAASVDATAPTAKVAAKNRLPLYAGLAVVLLLLAGGGYVVFAGKSGPQSTALQDMKVEELEKVLEARRKADAEAADKRRLEEEAQKKAADDAAAKQAADTALGKAQAERQKAETELARLKAELEVQKKAVAERQGAAEEQARRAAAEEAQRKVEAEMAALRQTEEDAAKKAAEEGEAKRRADEALARAQAERQKADAEAARQADEETRKKAEADAKTRAEAETKHRLEDERKNADAEARQKAEAEAAEKKAAELAEAGLRLAMVDRQRIQVALTSQGFDTRGSDGAFGPRSREMIAGWQKARNQPATGFLNVSQQQALLKEAAPALQKYDDDQKKVEEEKKKAEEEKKKVDEAKRKAEEEAKAKAAVTPAPAPAAPPTSAPATAVPSAATGGIANGRYSGGLSVTHHNQSNLLSVAVTVNNGSGSGTVTNQSCGAMPISLNVDPSGRITGNLKFTLRTECGTVIDAKVTGRVDGSRMVLEMNATTTSLRSSLTLARVAP